MQHREGVHEAAVLVDLAAVDATLVVVDPFLPGEGRDAASKFFQRDAKVVNVMANFADLVAGQEVQLASNADQSKTYASIYMHDNRLIILEATVLRNYPPPTIFQQSLGWLDENGVRIRYNNINHNEPDVPRPGIRGR